MSKVVKLIDAARNAAGIKSDNALAERLDVERQHVSNWRKGTIPEPYVLLRLAEMAGEDPAKVIAEVAAEREKHPERRRWLENFRAAACVAASILVTLFVTAPEKSYAKSMLTEAQGPVIQIIAVLLGWIRSAQNRLAGIGQAEALRLRFAGS